MDWELLFIFKIVPSTDTKWPLKTFLINLAQNNYSYLVLYSICLYFHFHPSLYVSVSLTVRWVSCRQQRVGSFLSVIKNLLIWLLRPLTFTVSKRGILTLPSSILEICWLTELIMSVPNSHSFIYLSWDLVAVNIFCPILCIFAWNIFCNDSLTVLSFFSLHLSWKVFVFSIIFKE